MNINCLIVFFLIQSLPILLFINSINAQTSPNIILIMADDMGFETVGAYGGETYETPHLNQMAVEGIRFEHCYSQPLCTPSRVEIMTGIYNIRNYLHFGFLHPSQTTFGNLLQNAGYATCAVGKWQLRKDTTSLWETGFGDYCLFQLEKGHRKKTERDSRYSRPVLESKRAAKTYEDEDYGPDIVSDYALNFIEEMTAKKQPFFLYYPMMLPHFPYSPTPDSEEWLTDREAVKTFKGDSKYFKDMVEYTDKIVGKINRQVIDLDIEENTLIIFTGDNGTETSIVSKVNDRLITGAKKTMTDGGTRVPLIVKWKGTIPSNQVSTDLVDFSDFLPTVCEAAQVAVPDSLDIDGQSFFAQLKGEKGQPRKWIYNWFDSNNKTQVFARNQKYKLYETGDFYNVPYDYSEQKPLQIANLSAKEKEVYQMLQGVLNSYANRGLDAVSSTPEQINYLNRVTPFLLVLIGGIIFFFWRNKS